MNAITIKTGDRGHHRVATLTDANGILRNITINPRTESRYGTAQAVHVALDERERNALEELNRVRAIRDVLPNRLTETTP